MTTLLDHAGDPWFELTPGLFTWALGRSEIAYAQTNHETTWPGDDLVDQTREQLDEGLYAPFTEAPPA